MVRNSSSDARTDHAAERIGIRNGCGLSWGKSDAYYYQAYDSEYAEYSYSERCFQYSELYFHRGFSEFPGNGLGFQQYQSRSFDLQWPGSAGPVSVSVVLSGAGALRHRAGL